MARCGLCFRPSKQVGEVGTIGKRRTHRRDDNPGDDYTRKPSGHLITLARNRCPGRCGRKDIFPSNQTRSAPRSRLFPWTENLSATYQ
jgi:hypothetical protein